MPLHAPPRSDARAWRRLALAFVLFGGVGLLLLVVGVGSDLRHSGETLRLWLGAGRHGVWRPLAAIVGFVGLAFLGLPQFVLVAAAVVVYGPWTGFAYSFVGNLVSAVLGFVVGRRFGARLLRDFAGAGLRDFMEMVGRRGLVASAMVRLAPSAPFVFVNIAAGVTPMRLTSFVLGTAIGSVPKIALTAFAGEQALRGATGGGWIRWATVVIAVAVWLGAAVWARTWWRARRSMG